MANKSRKSSRTVNLQEYELIPITDPAEQAALDERISRATSLAPGWPMHGTNGDAKIGAVVTSAQVSELFGQLPAQDRLRALAKLVEELAPDEQHALVQQVREQSAR